MVLVGAFLLSQATLTFSSGAAPASKVIPALGDRAGVSLSVAPALARETLLVQTKGVSLAEIMRRISMVTDGEWESTKDGGVRLTLSRKAGDRQHETEAILRGNALHKQLASETVFHSDGSGSVDPLRLILTRLSAYELGNLGYKQRIVYSTQPTAMQRRLSPEILRGIDFRRLDRSLNNRVNGAVSASARAIEILQIAIQSTADEDGISVTFTAADANGRTVFGRRELLYAVPNKNPPPNGWTALPRPNALVSPTQEERASAKRLPQSSAADALPAVLIDDTGFSSADQEYSASDLKEGPPPDLSELLRPESVDPLALAAGPLFTRLASSQGTSLVANLADESFSGSTELLVGGDLTAKEVVHLAWERCGAETTIDGNWMIVKPRRMFSARVHRIDRLALGIALRKLKTAGYLTLEEQASYASAQPLMPERETFEAQCFASVNVAFGKRIASSCASGERQNLRLYGLVVKGSQSSQTFSSLPLAAREVLMNMAFDSVIGPSRTIRTADAPSPRIRAAFGYSDQLGAPVSLALERTVFWPSGIPGSAVLTVESSVEPTYYGLAEDGARLRLSDRPTYSIRFRKNSAPVVSRNQPRLPKYVRGNTKRFVFALRDGPEIEMKRSVSLDLVSPESLSFGFDELPESVRRSFDRIDEQIKNAVEEGNRRMGQRMRP